MTKTNHIAVGRRKSSVARVYIKKGSGNITINGKDYKDYFTISFLQDNLMKPLKAISAHFLFLISRTI